jgi:glycosyltransferase involved in cell wall biosynthesis
VVWNDLTGLKRTRASLNKQKYKKWTHIIVDGGSKDKTVEYLNSLPKKNTIFVSEQDEGIYDAMNKGWKLADPNSFVYFLNARDLFADPSSLSEASEALATNLETNWGCTTHEERYADGSGWCCKLVSEPSIRNQLYAFGYRSHQGIIMRQSFLANLGGFDKSFHIAADWDLFVRGILLEKPTEWTFPLAVFELGGFSSTKILDAHRELIVLRKKYGVTTGKSRLYEELWRMLFLQYMGYSNPATKLYTKILNSRSHAIKILKVIPTLVVKLFTPKKYFKGFEFSLSIYTISIRRTRPRKIKRIKRQRNPKISNRQGIRSWAIERGILVLLNKKLQLNPYKKPGHTNSESLI